MRAARVFAGAAGAALFLGALGLGELYRYTFCREYSRLSGALLDKRNHADAYYAHRDGAAAALRYRTRREYTLESARGEKLRGYLYPAPQGGGKRMAFIVHGYRSEHAETAGMYYDYYASRGFDLFCCDNVASGGSEGDTIGYDFFESADTLRWLDFVAEEFGEDVQIALHGFSMGGATVLSISDRVPEQVKFIVSDSAFTTAEDILRPALGPLYAPLCLICRAVAGYDLSETDVRPHLRSAKVPILFVHGRQDPSVPFAMGEELYGLCPTEKDCLFVDEARHVECMHVAPEAYAAKLDAFIEKYLT